MLDRRQLLIRTGAALAVGAAFSDLEEVAAAREADAELDWASVRRLFRIAPGWTHMGGLLLASHPAPVRVAIGRHRRGLDANPVHYLHERGPELEAGVLRAAGVYLRARPADIALTDSTTMGLGLLRNPRGVAAEGCANRRVRSAGDALSERSAREPGRDRLVAGRCRRSADTGDRPDVGALEHGRQAAAGANRPGVGKAARRRSSLRRWRPRPRRREHDGRVARL
jgi:hypothetical protein